MICKHGKSQPPGTNPERDGCACKPGAPVDRDFWGWEKYGQSYLIVGRDGEELIGDGLPSTQEEAEHICRCQSRAPLRAQIRSSSGDGAV